MQPPETPTAARLRDAHDPTAMGTGARVLNAYSLVNSQAIYEGQRAAAPDQRVFILTRNGFAGHAALRRRHLVGRHHRRRGRRFKKQIPAGLGFSLSGVPYWTTDTGGFAMPTGSATAARPPPTRDEWSELNARWFQYCTFMPLLRVHGQSPNREMWYLGGETSPAYQTQLKFDRLRYRLLPYIYSLAGGVTHHAGTMLRPLVMDFPRRPARSRAIGDQYMFGPAFLVSPVTDYQARTPHGLSAARRPDGWYDFWTGTARTARQPSTAAAPYDAIPVHVRAGSIVPLGPELQYTAEKPADPITLYVYAGADGAFTLYEDDGTSYRYERGASARIPIAWDEATRTLTIGAREGSFPGMLARRRFAIVDVRRDRPVPFSFEPNVDRTVEYDGAAQSIVLPLRR